MSLLEEGTRHIITIKEETANSKDRTRICRGRSTICLMSVESGTYTTSFSLLH